jgi:glycosyltransferase involved in cell wall biosynthesis
MKQPSLKVAIVHDWLYGGGAELVVEQLHALFPDAPIYATFATREWRQRLDGKVVTGYLGRWPFNRLHKLLGVLRIAWYTHLKFDGYDLVISSSGAEAKGIRVPPGTLHINYCHAPTHYYWSRYDEYMRRPGLGVLDPLARIGLRLLVAPLRRWDYKAAQRPDYIIANSTHIQREIKKYYKRNSTVVFPPVYMERFEKHENRRLPRRGFVISGRHTPYKRFDLAVVACTKLGLPLTVIGTGPDHARLRKLAGRTVTFLGKVSDEVLEHEFASAEALIFPGLDDFGITSVEALASGTPVVAYKAGGALDYIKPGVTGEFFDRQNVTSLARTLNGFSGSAYSSAAIRASAQRFSSQAFQENMRAYITKCLAAHLI